MSEAKNINNGTLRVWWGGMLGHKIETAEACGGVVTLRIDQARELNQIVLQHNTLADALATVRRDVFAHMDGALLDKTQAVREQVVTALRLAGRSP